MDQNFNNGFDNQNSGNDGFNNNPYSNPFDQSQQSQQDYYNSYEQSTQQTQQNYAQQYQQPYGQSQQDYNQYNQYDQYDQNYNQPYNQPYGQPYGQQYGSMNQPDKSAKGFAIASLVLSILSFFCCGVIFSTLGIIFGYISLKKEQSGLAKAGLIVGIIALVGSILLTVVLNCLGGTEAIINNYTSYF